MIFKRKANYDSTRIDVLNLLQIKGASKPHIARVLQAYDYFSTRPHEFDGATIVKDLIDCHGFDLKALRHDYEYIVVMPQLRWFKWLFYKIIIDWQYGVDHELLGNSPLIGYSRAILLIISTPFYPIFKLFRK